MLGLFCVDLVEDDGKFIAPQSGKHVIGAQVGGYPFRHMTQNVVANLVTMNIIEFFEIIDIDK